MKYFVMRKYKYIRGFEHDMPPLEKCKNGFDDLETAEGAKAALEHLEHRPDMVSYIIVKEVQPWFTKDRHKETNDFLKDVHNESK